MVNSSCSQEALRRSFLILLFLAVTLASGQQPGTAAAAEEDDTPLLAQLTLGALSPAANLTSMVLLTSSSAQHDDGPHQLNLSSLLSAAEKEVAAALDLSGSVSSLPIVTLTGCGDLPNSSAIISGNFSSTASSAIQVFVDGIPPLDHAATVSLTLWFRVRSSSLAHALGIERSMERLASGSEAAKWLNGTIGLLQGDGQLVPSEANKTNDGRCFLCSLVNHSTTTNASVDSRAKRAFCVTALQFSGNLSGGETVTVSPIPSPPSGGKTAATIIAVVLVIFAILVVIAIFIWQVLRQKLKALKTKESQDRASKYREDENTEYWKRVKESTDRIMGKPLEEEQNGVGTSLGVADEQSPDEIVVAGNLERQAERREKKNNKHNKNGAAATAAAEPSDGMASNSPIGGGGGGDDSSQSAIEMKRMAKLSPLPPPSLAAASSPTEKDGEGFSSF